MGPYIYTTDQNWQRFSQNANLNITLYQKIPIAMQFSLVFLSQYLSHLRKWWMQRLNLFSIPSEMAKSHWQWCYFTDFQKKPRSDYKLYLLVHQTCNGQACTHLKLLLTPFSEIPKFKVQAVNDHFWQDTLLYQEVLNAQF